MRINRESLLKNVKTFVERQAHDDRTLLAVYLCGSMLSAEPLLGGSTDVDLVFVHTDTVSVPREIRPLFDDVHLDILHHYHRDYRQPRHLRVDPWQGPMIFNATVLHDPQHFMDFTQASVRGQFDRSDFVVQRARVFLERARQGWSEISAIAPDSPSAMAAVVVRYLKALENGVNAVMSLNGSPLVCRRLMADLPQRAAALQRPGLPAGLAGLLGSNNLDIDRLPEWVDAWQRTWEAVPQDVRPAELDALRIPYYRLAFGEYLEGTDPQQAVWPLACTWALAASCLPDSDPRLQEWQQAFTVLGLAGQLPERLEGLDAYLDTVEETMDSWAALNGA